MKDGKSLLSKAVMQNFTQSVVSDSVKANADFQHKAGLSPKIIRKSDGNCCEWCSKLAGVYDYPCDSTVYKRHNNCNCTVEYNPGTGKVQNVHTKALRDQTDRDILEMRKSVGLSTETATAA